MYCIYIYVCIFLKCDLTTKLTTMVQPTVKCFLATYQTEKGERIVFANNRKKSYWVTTTFTTCPSGLSTHDLRIWLMFTFKVVPIP